MEISVGNFVSKMRERERERESLTDFERESESETFAPFTSRHKEERERA